MKLGIIAGSGDLPIEIAKINIAQNGDTFVASLAGYADQSPPSECISQEFRLGQVGAIIDFFKQHKVSQVILIGGITRPDLLSLKVDYIGSKLIGRLLKSKFIGDDNSLKTIANFIEEQGLQVVSPREFLQDNNHLVTTKLQPNAQQRKDIAYGSEILQALSQYDIGQAVMVENSYILAIEAAEGTDNLIKRSRTLKKTKSGGILVKMPKQGQDMRLDLPTIGPNTITMLADNGFSGIAIDAKNVLIVKPEATKQLAIKRNLFLTTI